MNIVLLPMSYLQWHYSAAWGDLWRLYTNFAWFLWHFFSIPLLAQTLFAPWKRLRETGTGAGGFFAHLIINTVTRCVGFSIRSVTALAGFLTLGLLSLIAAVGMLAWLVLPALIFLALAQGALGILRFFAGV